MNTKVLKISTFAIIAILAFSCKNYETAKMDFEPLGNSTVTHSIQKFIEEFGRDNNVFDDSDMLPVRTNAGTEESQSGIYSVNLIPQRDEAMYIYKVTIKGVDDKGKVYRKVIASQIDNVILEGNEEIEKKDTIVIPPAKRDIIIAGRVISDDSQGNYYKSIAIQDLNDPKYALKISIDASGIGAWYPLGSVISIRCNGLAIGKYADMFQLGSVFFNNNADAAKTGYEPGRIPLPLFQTRAKVHSLPELNKIFVDTLTIKQILDLATIKGNSAVVLKTDRQMHSRLVCIKGVRFTQKGDGVDSPNQPADRIIFAPSTDKWDGAGPVGYPQAVEIADDANDKINICTSEYARFCNVTIPSEEYKGNVTAIVAWYMDKKQYAGKVQLTIRFLNDLDLYHKTTGKKWEPDNQIIIN